MNPEQWLSLKWNGGSTMSDRWLNQSKIIHVIQRFCRDFTGELRYLIIFRRYWSGSEKIYFRILGKTDNLEEKQQCDQRKIRVQLSKFKKTYMDVIVKAVEAEIPEKIVKSYIWDAMNEEEKEQGDNKLRDLDGNEIKNDNVPQKGVQ